LKVETKALLEKYKKYSYIENLEENIIEIFKVLKESYQNNRKLLVCGNGGSASDSDHIVGELVKGFRKKRKLSLYEKENYSIYGIQGFELAEKLQGGLKAINLSAHTALLTAISNDIGGDYIFAQQVNVFGEKNDIFLGITTSGNSKNIINACYVAKIKGMKTILLSGRDGGESKNIFDYNLIVPFEETCDIQNAHIVIYHLLCAMLEEEFWEE
jgi:D-sedoheptulose 7-phosphate isomerase